MIASAADARLIWETLEPARASLVSVVITTAIVDSGHDIPECGRISSIACGLIDVVAGRPGTTDVHGMLTQRGKVELLRQVEAWAFSQTAKHGAGN